MASRPRRVIWTEQAREQLDEILAFLAEDSPEAASNVLDVILSVAESLAVLSKRGRVVPELGQPDTREVFVYSYRLMYDVSDEDVRILAVLHGARDFDRWRRR